jgi:hypothetical protein
MAKIYRIIAIKYIYFHKTAAFSIILPLEEYPARGSAEQSRKTKIQEFYEICKKIC